ncbi:polyprenyl synthetase family protein [Streptomyces sp. NPDC051994]|uniref:polyprenyl synthetase family protein n=1 Tax=unclassified Streptomyces TaxID=2593676 RepID=UPI003414387D
MAALTAKMRGRSLFSRLTVPEKKLERRLLRNLELVEARLEDCAGRAADPRVTEIVGHLVAAGGKRMRPLLTLLAAEFGDSSAPGVIDAAVVAELVHTASLHHDDVMDRAAIRHGVPSVNAQWGNSVAVKAGNWLLARAAQLSAGLDASAVPLQAEASERLILGQIQELAGPARPEDRLSHYFGVVSDKSAALISFSLRLGALQAGAPAHVGEVLAEYGEHLGVAFQISDDLIDITSSPSLLGKEQGKDLAVGVSSLPVLLVLSDADPRNDELRALLAGPEGLRGESRRRALALLQESRAMDRAGAIMNEHLAKARSALAELPVGPPRRALDGLCDFVASRKQ